MFTSIEKCDETFQQIQIELRNDYLIRGICEREVDQVVREVKNMKHIFFLKRYSGIFEGTSTPDRKNLRRFFAFESLHLTELEWEKIINCVGNK